MPLNFGTAGATVGGTAGFFLGGPVGAAVGDVAGGVLGSFFDKAPAPSQIDTNQFGFQGVYQKFLQSENTRLQNEEQQRIMKLASNAVPGAATLRSVSASQGVTGATSNVIAKQQRNAGLSKALDTGLSASEDYAGRLDSQYYSATAQNEGMLLGAEEFNANATNQQNNMTYQAGQSMTNNLMGMGSKILGNYLGKSSLPGDTNSPSSGSGSDFAWKGIPYMSTNETPTNPNWAGSSKSYGFNVEDIVPQYGRRR